MKKVSENINIENAKLVFRNFAGKAGQYNPEGNRNFCVLLETKIAEELISNGWNIKWLLPRDPEESKQAYFQVKVTYNKFPPHIILVTNKGKTLLTEDSISLLDWAEIDNADLIVNPYNWEVNGKKGVKAYLKSLYITLKAEDFEGKYRNVPDADNFEEDDS